MEAPAPGRIESGLARSPLTRKVCVRRPLRPLTSSRTSAPSLAPRRSARPRPLHLRPAAPDTRAPQGRPPAPCRGPPGRRHEDIEHGHTLSPPQPELLRIHFSFTLSVDINNSSSYSISYGRYSAQNQVVMTSCRFESGQGQQREQRDEKKSALPSNRSAVRHQAHDNAWGDSYFRWMKPSGAGARHGDVPTQCCATVFPNP
jgi:hypothetical protein